MAQVMLRSTPQEAISARSKAIRAAVQSTWELPIPYCLLVERGCAAVHLKTRRHLPTLLCCAAAHLRTHSHNFPYHDTFVK